MARAVASYEAGRQLLEQGRRSVGNGRLDDAGEAFASAVKCFAGPTPLLGGGHAWRGLAEVAVSKTRWDEANASLDAAERLFKLGTEQVATLKREPEIERQLFEGLMICGVARADIALRQDKLQAAHDRLNDAVVYYPNVGVQGRADLWRLIARLSEREGRWNVSRMAWNRVAKMAGEAADHRGRTDALVRLTEVLVLMNRPQDADDALADAEEAARSTMEAKLLGRVHMARAGLLELRGDLDGAWDRWEVALEALVDAGPILQGLARVRLALLAARIRPLEASFLIKEGLKHLIDGTHPDALGIIHHQLALVALEMGNLRVAALAAVGAEEARGHRGIATQSILARAREDVGEDATIDDIARLEGLVGTVLGTRRSAIDLADRLGKRAATPRPSAARQMRPGPKFVWSDGDGVREEPLRDGVVTMGSMPDADIQIPAEGVNVAIRKDASGVRVQVDPFSPQPVLLDGHAIRGEHFLTDGDVLVLGDLELKHVLPSPSRPPLTKTPAPAPKRSMEDPSPPVLPEPVEPARRGSVRVYGLVFVVSTGLISGLLGALLASMLMLLFAAM